MPVQNLNYDLQTVEFMQKPSHSIRPLRLIIAILIGVMGTALVAYKVWSNQYQLIQAGLLQERQQTLQLLASDLESSIQKMLSQSLRYLFAEDSFQLTDLRVKSKVFQH